MQIDLGQLLYFLKDNYYNRDTIFFGYCLSNIDQSKSQNFQDVWALYENYFKKHGFFVEFGSTNGVNGSNSYLLHKNYGWYGILAEPNPIWHNELKNNRQDHRCRIVTDCVYTVSGETVEFLATDEPDLSTIKGFGKDDEHESKRNNAKTIKVNTISLYDLLYNNDAPNVIEYMSVDTEGSEYDILKAFFDDPRSEEYMIRCITVEHNFNNSNRDRMFNLLTSNGYKRKFEYFSRWDDFYAKDI